MRKQDQLGLVLALLLSLPCAAQYSTIYQEAPRWHLNGSAGFGLYHDTSNVQTVSPGLSGTTSDDNFLQYGGDIQLNAAGFLKDPRLLLFTAGIADSRSLSSSENAPSAFGTGGLSMNFTGTFLNGRGSPLTVSYLRSNINSSGFGGSHHETTSSLGLMWRMNFRHLPKTTFSYQSSEYDTQFPLTLFEGKYQNHSLGVSTDGEVKDWRYSVGFTKGWSTSESLGTLNLPQPQDSDNTNLTGHVDRNFWNRRATFTENGFINWQDTAGSLGNSGSRTLSLNSAFRYLFTNKLSASLDYGYGSSQVNLGAPTTLPGATILLLLPSSTQQDASGDLHYQALSWLGVTGTIHYSLNSPVDVQSEFVQRFLTPTFTVTAFRTWHRIGFNGSYSIGRQMMTSNLGNTASNWSHGLNLNLSWGDLRRVRLSGGFSMSNNNVAQLLGAFYHDRRISFQADSNAFAGWHFSLHGDQLWREALTPTGDISSRNTGVFLSAGRRLFTVTAGQTFTSGYGSIFRSGFVPVPGFIQTLPLQDLINSPLVDQSLAGTSITFTAFPRRNLNVSGSWIHNTQTLNSYNQSANSFSIIAGYRYGKFSFSGGYANYDNDFLTLLTSNRTNTHRGRIYFRFARHFTIF